jgi:hypothetical protein
MPAATPIMFLRHAAVEESSFVVLLELIEQLVSDIPG